MAKIKTAKIKLNKKKLARFLDVMFPLLPIGAGTDKNVSPLWSHLIQKWKIESIPNADESQM